MPHCGVASRLSSGADFLELHCLRYIASMGGVGGDTRQCITLPCTAVDGSSGLIPERCILTRDHVLNNPSEDKVCNDSGKEDEVSSAHTPQDQTAGVR